MTKQLIVERTAAEVKEVLTESADGAFRFTAVLSEANVRNRNGRVYPRNLLEDAVLRAKPALLENPGKLEHPDFMGGSVSDNVLVWEDLWFEGNQLIGRARLIETAKGNDLRANIKAGVKVGFSKRGYGRTEESLWEGQLANVLVEYDLETIDQVDRPSHTNARVRDVLGENVELKEIVEQAVAAALKNHVSPAEQTLRESVVALEKANAELVSKLAAVEGELKAAQEKLDERAEDAEIAATVAAINTAIGDHRFADGVRAEVAKLAEAGIVVTAENAAAVVARVKVLVEAAAAGEAPADPAGIAGKGANENANDENKNTEVSETFVDPEIAALATRAGVRKEK